jgi:hypothetical protein
MKNEDEINQVLKDFSNRLLSIGIPAANIRLLLTNAFETRDVFNALADQHDKEEKLNILLNYADTLFREALLMVFTTASITRIKQDDAAEIALSGLLTHAANGCVMLTPDLEAAKGFFNGLCEIAFKNTASISEDSKREITEEIMQEKKDAPIH